MHEVRLRSADRQTSPRWLLRFTPRIRVASGLSQHLSSTIRQTAGSLHSCPTPIAPYAFERFRLCYGHDGSRALTGWPAWARLPRPRPPRLAPGKRTKYERPFDQLPAPRHHLRAALAALAVTSSLNRVDLQPRRAAHRVQTPHGARSSPRGRPLHRQQPRGNHQLQPLARARRHDVRTAGGGDALRGQRRLRSRRTADAAGRYRRWHRPTRCVRTTSRFARGLLLRQVSRPSPISRTSRWGRSWVGSCES